MKNKALFLIILLSLLLPLIYLKSNQGLIFVYDDSYITLKFAKNFFPYQGLTFDGINYNQGATSVLHILILVFLNLFFHNLELSAIILGIISFSLLVYLSYLLFLLLTGNKNIGLLTALLTATTGWLIFDALSGLETIIFIDLLLLTIYLFERKKVYYGLTLGLLILTRPEGIFLALALLVYLFLERLVFKKVIDFKKELIFPFLLTFLILLPYFYSNLKTTNSLLSQTGFAKAYFFDEVKLPLKIKIEFFGNGLKLFYYNLIFPFGFLFFLLLPFGYELFKKYYLVIFALIFYLAYFYLFPGALNHYWCRYQHIFYPFVIATISVGIHSLYKTKWKYLFIFLLVFNQFLSLLNVYEKYKNSIESTKEVLIEMANYFRTKTDKEAVIATHDIGALGYFSERKILDLVGLVNPEMRNYCYSHRKWERNLLDYVVNNAQFLVMFDFFKIFLNFDPKNYPENFVFLGETKPVFGLNQRYQLYGIIKNLEEGK